VRNGADNSGAFYVSTANAGTPAERMRIDSAGNVGIGTTSPTAITNYRTITLDGTTGSILDLRGNGTLGARIVGTASSMALETGGATPMSFWTNNAERMRIDSSGNLLVGTTAGNGSRFEVYASAEIARFYNTSGQGTIRFVDGANVTKGSIVWDSTLTVYNTTSDYRLKTVVGSVTGQGERIDALQPVEYTWKENGTRTRGFLAHQFQEVYAGSVTGTKDAVDAEGKPVYQAMQASTSEVIADLVAELQSLRARVAALESI
jgi:hypothetical protein